MKSLFLNIVALAFFSACAAASGMLTQETLIFQMAAQWLVNELWFDAYLVPLLLLQLLGRKGEGRDEARQRRAARWTSFCLLLIPAILFGVLSLVENLSSNALGNWLGLPLGVGLFTCSFAGFALLFILSLFSGAMPLSVQAAIEKFVDDKMGDAEAEVKSAIKAEVQAALKSEAARQDAAPVTHPEPPPTRELASVPSRHSHLYAAHERAFARKQQAGEELILSTAPAGTVPMAGELQSYLVGGGCGAAGLLLLSLAYQWQQSGQLGGMALGLLCIMGAVFLFFALPMLLAPLRWRKRLQSIDYFITDRRLLIYYGDKVHIQPWNEACICQLMPREGTRGDVAVIRKGLGYRLVRGFFKRWAALNEEETRRSFDQGPITINNGKDMQTQALINVEGAAAIHDLITQLLAAHEK